MDKLNDSIKSKLPISAKAFNEKLKNVENRLGEELALNRELLVSHTEISGQLLSHLSNIETKLDYHSSKIEELQSANQNLLILVDALSTTISLQANDIITSIKNNTESHTNQIIQKLSVLTTTIETQFAQLTSLAIQAIDSANKQTSESAKQLQQDSINKLNAYSDDKFYKLEKHLSTLHDKITDNKTIIAEYKDRISQQAQSVGDNYKELNNAIIKTQSFILADIKNNIEHLLKQLNQEQQKSTEKINNDISEVKGICTHNHTELMDKLKRIENQARTNYFTASEAVWAQVFQDTIAGSLWLKDKSFSAGRWGVGYAFLYILYRVLKEFKPANILEMGLGESTKMIMQYAKKHTSVAHTVTEHNQEWIEFFINENKLSTNTSIKLLSLENTTYKTDKRVLSYAKFEEEFANKKFDLICIDAPYGGQAVEFARVDVCRLLPSILAKSFVIMLDDSQRKGETNTIKEMESILTESKIPYKSGKYRGIKENYVLVSEDLAFLCTL